MYKLQQWSSGWLHTDNCVHTEIKKMFTIIHKLKKWLSESMLCGVSDLLNAQMSNFLAISWREQVTF